MNDQARGVQRVYLTLTLLNTLAASLIWGINTLFLLDAGLSNTEAFAANAFFTAGMVLFEVPTGIVADSRGRRMSFLLGTFTLSFSTALYLIMWATHAPFIGWAIASVIIGLGFTFFSGAVEAWLVDAMQHTKFTGNLENVFAKGQIVSGIAMLSGSVAGGVIAQISNLGVPYIIRSAVLIISFIAGFLLMRDLGFTPTKSKHPLKDINQLFFKSVRFGLRERKVRWLMLSAPFSAGVGIYVFYAMQPYLLKLYGDPKAYSIAGLVAAIVAGAQIVGGILVPQVVQLFHKRTTLLLSFAILNTTVLFLFGLINTFWVAVVLIVLWAIIFAANMPIRQTYLNGVIPSSQRATVLSFDSMMGSGGGVVFQPALGKVADVYSYSASYMVGSVITAFAWPFIYLARKERAKSDLISSHPPEVK